MKRFITAALSAALLVFAGAATAVKGMGLPIDIAINGEYIQTDVKPFLISGTTYVPVRFISEALSARVSWEQQTETARIEKDGTDISMQIGKSYALINGGKAAMTGEARLVEGRTFVPVRFIAEALGAAVDWDGSHLNVLLHKSGISPLPQLVYDRGYTDADVYWLGRIINAEAEGEPMEGKIGVGDVVLNRVKSDIYPNTVYDVIFDSNFGIQFEPVLNGRIYDIPSFDSLVAAKNCLQGANAVGDSLFFLNPAIAASSWITNNRQHVATVGNHLFYL